MNEFIQVVTTAGSKDEASKIGRHLLELRLSGCIQVSGPITSSYWWKGAIESSDEWYCIVKTKAKFYAEVEREIRSVHSYEEPEILAFPVEDGSASYLAWLSSCLRSVEIADDERK
jgi:periplasmic divalent cation tolerance protein